jgi:hypothetical protein
MNDGVSFFQQNSSAMFLYLLVNFSTKTETLPAINWENASSVGHLVYLLSKIWTVLCGSFGLLALKDLVVQSA